MFSSLRSRLIFSYVLVVVLTLCIAGAALLLLLQDYQRGIVKQRLSDALGPAVIQARTLSNEGIAPAEISAEIQDQVDRSWFVLLIDPQGKVIADSQNQFVGRTLQRAANVRNLGARPIATGDQIVAGRDLAFAVAPLVRGGKTQALLVLATVIRPFITGLTELSIPLLTAGAVALVVALIIGLLFARSISEPIGRLTRATEEIARGNFEAQIPISGKDEVARLGARFNTMARAVYTSQQMQKDFVANVSHELKTPLTSIQGFSQAIVEGATRDLDSARRAAKLIFEESQRMARLVGDLLTLARLDAGDGAIDQTTLNLTSMLPAWITRLKPRAEAAHISLALTVDSPPLIVGDAGRLEQVLTNLVDNAIKYNRPGGHVQVSASAAPPDERGARASNRRVSGAVTGGALIRVRDDGLGIPRASLSRLFERFYRGDKARVAGGSGLGLAIVQEIVSVHHGRIDIVSEEGHGTTFSVWLPAKGEGARQGPEHGSRADRG